MGYELNWSQLIFINAPFSIPPCLPAGTSTCHRSIPSLQQHLPATAPVPEPACLRSSVSTAIPRTSKERSDHHLPRWKSKALPHLRKHHDLPLEDLDQIVCAFGKGNVPSKRACSDVLQEG